MTIVYRDRLARLMNRAAQLGGVWKSATLMEWDAHGNCTHPLTRDLYARQDRKKNHRDNGWVHGEPHPLRLIFTVRCRRCDACRKAKGRMWYARARVEVARARRTWFGTFTIRPEERFKAELLARQDYARAPELDDQGAVVPFSKLARQLRNQYLHKQYGAELQKYLKRLRKGGLKFRYLLVTEEHKDGALHYHALLHEMLGGKSIPKRTLEGQWLLGHSSFRLLLDPIGVKYVCKYISKSLEARVRASKLYGMDQPPEAVGSPAPVEYRNESTHPNEGVKVPAGRANAGGLLAAYSLEETFDLGD